MNVKVYGKPNYHRFAETWMAILAAKEGLEIVPGSVRVELRSAEAKPSEERRWNCSAEEC